METFADGPAANAMDPALAVARARAFPRLRYMGSKHRLVPTLAEVFAEVGGLRALDAFSGSGVVAYTLKALGFAVVANDLLTFPSLIAAATVANDAELLTEDDIATITGPAADDRDFVQRTFAGLYFTTEDRQFLDAAWSHIDRLAGAKRALAIAGLLLAAARKQPRGVFTVTDLRYDDGRRDLRRPLREQFRDRARDYNQVVFAGARPCAAMCADVFQLDPAGHDLVYLDPPYAPPRDDNCYIKRYHFLEGLAVYWRGTTILEQTRTKKLAKRHTPFSSKRTIVEALGTTFDRFRAATIVLSYSSNSVPDADTVAGLLREVKGAVEVRKLDHRYSFGTHQAARRRTAAEYLFIAS